MYALLNEFLAICMFWYNKCKKEKFLLLLIQTLGIFFERINIISTDSEEVPHHYLKVPLFPLKTDSVIILQRAN